MTMAETRGKKALSLCILRVLEQHASKEAPLTTRQIIELLQSEFSMKAERKSVGRNLLLLSDMGFPLSTYQQNGKGYYLLGTAGAPCTNADKGILLDALLRAPLSDYSQQMMTQLQEGDPPVWRVPSVKKQLNALLLQNLSLLKQAIRDGVQVSFFYNSIAPDGSLKPQRSTPYLASPYALAFADGCYYVILAISGYGKPLYYRCDLISQLKTIAQPIRPIAELQDCKQGLDVEAFIQKSVYQSSDSNTHVLLCAKHLTGCLINTFGANVTVEDGDPIRACVVAPWARVREFLLRNLKHAVLLAPQDKRTQLRDELSAACGRYQ